MQTLVQLPNGQGIQNIMRGQVDQCTMQLQKQQQLPLAAICIRTSATTSIRMCVFMQIYVCKQLDIVVFISRIIQCSEYIIQWQKQQELPAACTYIYRDIHTPIYISTTTSTYMQLVGFKCGERTNQIVNQLNCMLPCLFIQQLCRVLIVQSLEHTYVHICIHKYICNCTYVISWLLKYLKVGLSLGG
eukprot:TRINITY_DN4549_c0_g1_i13.p3 TRINITY_DN4549_c0_g1~~TRINITY_DN4549_c0_g1_i13.p3  ORF type:complete len:188 (-),score=-23.88 TRINITY_DN4549_c0_g1_i13:236-799(-)